MKYKKWVIGTVVVIALAIGGFIYWHHSVRYPSTADAYVRASVVTISPQINGRISILAVHDHQQVKKGQLLIQIDPEPYRIALDSAKANLKMARQKSQAAGAGVSAARALVEQRRTALNQANDNAHRIKALYRKHTAPKAQLDDADSKRDSARAALVRAKADLQKAIQEQAAAGNGASVQVMKAALEKARLELSYTRITAPASGVLGGIDVRVGDVVKKTQALFPLIEDGSFWIDANFKETDLSRIRSGQPATITVDMEPDETLHGTVDSISPASGVAFSLLPPENATGNWVKVSQRFPVKITLTEQDPPRPLRIGASAEVTVNTMKPGG